MDTLGGFKVGDRVRCRDTDPNDGGDFWQGFKRGVVGSVERIYRGGTGNGGAEPSPGAYYPIWDYLVVGGNFYRPHWLTKIEDAPKAEPKPSKPLGYDFENLFRFKGPLLPREPLFSQRAEHDELLTLRAERDSERRWAAHWKSVADKREDEFKRATTAEVECAALADVVENLDGELKALKVENRALKICRDDWISEAADSKKAARDAREDASEAFRDLNSALRLRNISLAVASAVVGSSGYVLYSCWGLL